jgi:alginate O-acetyltransferase complex protein AlgI
MVFSSGEFLFLFLPLTLAIYYATRAARLPLAASNAALLAMSWAFYFWGSGPLLLLLLAVTAVNYLCGRFVVAAQAAERTTTPIVALAVAFDLGVLAYFKFSNFFVSELNSALEFTGSGPLGWQEVLLPIGISFYIFQAVTYVIDVARRDAPAVRNPLDFALYIALFPQLIAGPIVRYRDIAAGLTRRSHEIGGFTAGVARFAHGLVKKGVLADGIGAAADLAFSDPGAMSMAGAWIGLVAYTLQIYFDFSGYSDMAIGLGHMFGFRFPENFRRPYSSLSITDFWRRWHITLSTFFRDYAYIPLGGSRRGARITTINLIFVFLVTGLWHGANWTFIAWGAYHGVLLLVERACGWRRTTTSGSVPYDGLRRFATLALVMVGWVIFRADSMSDALDYFQALGGFSAASLSVDFRDLMDHRFVTTLVLAGLVVFLPRGFVTGLRLEAAVSEESTNAMPAFVVLAYVLASLAVVALIVSAQSYSPFLYFQF